MFSSERPVALSCSICIPRTSCASPYDRYPGARVDPVGNEQPEFVVVARRASRDAQPLSELTDAQ